MKSPPNSLSTEYLYYYVLNIARIRFQTAHTYILQVKLELLLIGLKLTGQLIALMVERKQTLQEG